MGGELQHFRREARGFRPEDKAVVRREGKTVYGLAAPGAGTDQPAACTIGLKISIERGPYLPVHMRPVIKPRPLEMLIVNDKAQWFDKVELYARASTKPRHVAGVRRYLGMVENYMEHGFSLIEKDAPARTETSTKTAEISAAYYP
jgi:hypothetical protein